MQSCTPDPDKSYTKPISKQEINSYGMYVHSDYPEIYKSQYFHYDGDDVVKKYVEKIMSIFKKITYNIKHNKKDKPILNKYEEDEFQEATECYICGEEFEENNKVREHDHLSGKYRGAACQSCNTKEGKATKLIPVFFHNGLNYDFHFLIEELMKHEDEYNKVKLLSKNSENYISIDYGSYYEKLRFLDSYRFMLKGLSDVAKSMDDFPILEKEFEDYRILDEHEGKGCLEKLKNGGNLNNCFKKNYLLYLDANNLYGWSMSKNYQQKDFKWEEDPDYYKKVPKGRGCLIKCDLKYTDKCKKKTIKYPLAPEKTRPKKEELSNYQLNLLGNKPLGQAILDYSKQLMYDFYYNVVNKLWKKNELIASDTDSIFLNIKTEDIYEDMKK
ncbi:unnamed protein product [Mytilus coruscus]|uniref:DNA-directed DNA polymerase n=1 Tax=Mytilus coruscus TaxID=42192 RepID=A0A6J8F1S7_MYTCO|nr:unnamed protein product [Mytilus coruscus]